jgi:hypothetical protein
VSLTSPPEHVEKSIQFCLLRNLPLGEEIDESHQILITFRAGTSLIQPYRRLRENIVLCVTYPAKNEVEGKGSHAANLVRFCALYQNESTDGKWQLGEYFVVGQAAAFVAQEINEQLVMLGFKPN